MSVLETTAIFVGVPLAIYVLIALLSMIPGRAKRRPGYRPGQSWDYPPQWWAGDLPVVSSAGRETPVGAAASTTGALHGSAGSEGGADGNW